MLGLDLREKDCSQSDIDRSRGVLDGTAVEFHHILLFFIIVLICYLFEEILQRYIIVWMDYTEHLIRK